MANVIDPTTSEECEHKLDEAELKNNYTLKKCKHVKGITIEKREPCYMCPKLHKYCVYLIYNSKQTGYVLVCSEACLIAWILVRK